MSNVAVIAKIISPVMIPQPGKQAFEAGKTVVKTYIHIFLESEN